MKQTRTIFYILIMDEKVFTFFRSRKSKDKFVNHPYSTKIKNFQGFENSRILKTQKTTKFGPKSPHLNRTLEKKP